MKADDVECGTGRTTEVDGAGRMVLHPLAEICIGVFVSIRISGRKLVVDVLSNGERGQRQQKGDQPERYAASEECKRETHGLAIEYHKAAKPVKMIEQGSVLPDILIGSARSCRLFVDISLCCATSSVKGGT